MCFNSFQIFLTTLVKPYYYCGRNLSCCLNIKEEKKLTNQTMDSDGKANVNLSDFDINVNVIFCCGALQFNFHSLHLFFSQFST